MEVDPGELRTHFTDLLDARLGGRAIECSDQWFAGCENLVNPDPPVYKDRHFISTGQWMDGWESRRSFGRSARTSDYDWCVLRLGAPGTIFALNIDTSHFKGNAPEHASVEGAWQPVGEETDLKWFELLPASAIEPDSPNYFRVMSDQLASHLRLKIFPDGGVARLRAFGEVRLAREQFAADELVDLASIANGARSQQCSNQFFSTPANLLMPNTARHMGDGWETKRRRDEDHDWCIIKLGTVGDIRKVVIDTSHFRGNFPDSCCLEGINSPNPNVAPEGRNWQTILPTVPLQADRTHIFTGDFLNCVGTKFSHVRLNIYPDGGVSRLRVYGAPVYGDGK